MWKSFLVKFSNLIRRLSEPLPPAPCRDTSLSNFTPRACQVLALARKEADRLNHNFLGTEHLLLGLIKLGQGVAVQILKKRGASLEGLRSELEKQTPSGPDQKMIGNIPYTPRTKKVIALAQKEAKSLNHTYVGTEHLLLGMLREGDGVAAKVLVAHGLNLIDVRQEFLQAIDPNFVAQPVEEKPGATVQPQPNPEPEPEPETGHLNFTPHALVILALARQEANRFNHHFLGTEHLLLGLIKSGPGIALNVLQKMNINPEAIVKEIETAIPPGPDQLFPRFTDAPYTPRVKKVVALAQKEAKQLNKGYVGSEHLLLGMLREGRGVAGRILQKHGLELEKTRQLIVAEQPMEPQPPLNLAQFSRGALTPRTHQVLALARQEADDLKHDHLGTEHLLLGLIKLDQGMAANVLRKKGLPFEAVRAEIKKHFPAQPEAPTNNVLRCTPELDAAIALAQAEAKNLNHAYVGTEHLLLGLLHQGDGAAGKVLQGLKVDMRQLRQEILKQLDPNFTPPPSPPE